MTGKARKEEQTVDGFIAAAEARFRPVLETVRRTILSADRRIFEGIKWNAPSFRTNEWFATTNVRGTCVRLILHLGAKAKAGAQPEVADPAGLLEWLGKDRAMVSFSDEADAGAKAKALKALVQAWIVFVPEG